MMRVFTKVTAAVLATVLIGASGQAAPGTEPKELPPASFTGNQYVDSAGCVFLRAALAGKTAWVPRVNRDRQPVCGYEPTAVTGEAAATPASVAAPAAPAPEPAPAPAAQPVPAPAAEPMVATPMAVATVKPKTVRRTVAPKSVALVHRKTVPTSATYCADRITAAQRYLLSDGRRVTQCAARSDAPAVGYLNGLGIPGLQVSDRTPSAAEIRRAERLDTGAYRVTYARGRLTEAGQAAMTPVAVSGAYVQVGAFAEPANAERAIATLKALGLPVSVGVGGRLKVILTGPFATSADVASALSLVRRNGYRDAFPTRG